MDRERCEVVYKRVHGDKVVVVAVSQVDESDAVRSSRIHVLVCRIVEDFDEVQLELNKRGRRWNREILSSLVPETYVTSAVLKLSPLPVSDGPRGDKGKYGLMLVAWADEVGIDTSDLATSVLSQSAAMPKFGNDATLSLPEVLVTEALVSGAIGAWGWPLVTYMTANGLMPTRSLEERRPIVPSVLRTLPRFGLQNNIRVYANAFGYGIEKAHKDVRTYREARRRIEEERRGQK